VRSKIATRQHFVFFFMQKARGLTGFSLLKKIHSFQIIDGVCLRPEGSRLACPTLKSSPAMVGTFAVIENH